MQKTTFALFFGNRGFFPSSLIAGAREELPRVLKELGHEILMLEEEATPYGAVETPREGELYAKFLQENRGKFEGVILCLPNFGDETGAVAALKEAGVPILVHAYPDDPDKMGPADRRDSFCGKISIMDVFYQYDLPFTALKPHVVSPSSPRFRENIDYFDRVCRVVSGLRGMTVGAIGARTTPFKTVRIDEVALQRNGITMETMDLSQVIARVNAMDVKSEACKAKAEVLKNYTKWDGIPQKSYENLIKLGVVLDEVIEESKLDALAIRCWVEMQQQLSISPCIVLSLLNGGELAAACEVDVGSAVAMHALKRASGQPVACLDWNNNYGDDDDKCILFHCGQVPTSLMVDSGKISDQLILANSLGPGCGFGSHQGRFRPFDFTFSGMTTGEGKLRFLLGEGQMTADPIPTEFYGCAGVAKIDRLQDVLLHIGRYGHRHHVGLTASHVMAPMHEALQHYLGFEVTVPQSASGNGAK